MGQNHCVMYVYPGTTPASGRLQYTEHARRPGRRVTSQGRKGWKDFNYAWAATPTHYGLSLHVFTRQMSYNSIRGNCMGILLITMFQLEPTVTVQ